MDYCMEWEAETLFTPQRSSTTAKQLSVIDPIVWEPCTAMLSHTDKHPCMECYEFIHSYYTGGRLYHAHCNTNWCCVYTILLTYHTPYTALNLDIALPSHSTPPIATYTVVSVSSVLLPPSLHLYLLARGTWKMFYSFYIYLYTNNHHHLYIAR